MKPVLLALALLQFSGTAPLLAARAACVQHEGAVAHHASHQGAPAEQHAGHDTDCAHCPPVDCARHVGCAPVAVAVIAAPVAPSLSPVASGHAAAEAGPARSQPQSPPLTPPRLIA